jgi:4-hydroxybenzoate polyprenyltransferase
VRAVRSTVALWRSSHPGPTLVVSALTLILGLSAGLDAARLVLLVVAVFVGQLSVGWCNDAADARRDAAVGRRDKPVARGEIAPRTVGAAAGLALAVALVLSAVLGPALLVAHAVALASAWSYNLVLKRTAFSVAPFVVSFGLLPSLATLALPMPELAAPWASVAGAALGVAVHFSNVLPDFDDDAATGVRGLPHRVGARASAVVAFVAVAVGAAAVLLGPLIAGRALQPASVIGTVVVVVIGIMGMVRAMRRPDRTVFRLVMLAALVLATQLALTGVSVA